MSAPAGWHRQDDGRERYWNGEQWTEHFRDYAPASETPAGVDPPRPVPFWRRPWVLTAAGFVALVTAIGAFGSPADDPEPEEQPTAAATAEPSPTAEATTEAAVEPEPTEEPGTAADDQVLAEEISTLLGDGESWAPSWVAPITSIEADAGSQVRVAYQDTLTEDEKVQLGQYIHNFVRADVPEGTTSVIIITDTSGVDFNVWCGPTRCAADVLDTDR